MRLLKRDDNGKLSLTKDLDGDIPRYAILSHTWGAPEEEISFEDFTIGSWDKAGFKKVLFCAEQADRDNLKYFWVDTCCIDKSNSIELSEAINSMFRWYRNATRCYVYLSDVSEPPLSAKNQQQPSGERAFRNSRWFKRGWTLQELIAPKIVEFFSAEGNRLGDKESLKNQIHEITGIDDNALSGSALSEFSIEVRMSWTAKRETLVEEDAVYCLFGIFGIHMPLIYGEGYNSASKRLQRTIQDYSNLKLDDNSARATGHRFGSTYVGADGKAHLGNSYHSYHHSPPRPEYTGHFSHSSSAPVAAYVARPALYNEIRTQLWGADQDSTTTLVVWGLGGAGKTQLALDYMRYHRNDYRASFWLEARQKELLERDLVDLYQTLFGVQMAARQEPINVESAVVGVKSWFSGKQGPWLLVFDGADTIENKKASDYINIKHFIPDVPGLHIIITSRSGSAKDITGVQGVQVGEMEKAEAVELFYRYSQLLKDEQNNKKEVEAIVEELGYLALAVTLAAAYFGGSPRLQSNIEAYLPEYRRRQHELLGQKPESLIHQYSESVLTTWETSYQAVKEVSPEASILMTMLSYLGYDDIFLQLFGTSAQAESKSAVDRNEDGNSWRYILFAGQTMHIHKIQEWFGILQSYSLVQWERDRKSYTMQKLVNEWGYHRLPLGEQSRFSFITSGLITDAIDGCGNRPEEKLRLVPHIMANFSRLVEASNGSNSVPEVILDGLENAGWFVRELGRWAEGRGIQEFILKERRKVGEDHPSTITAMDNLAVTLREQGLLGEATKMQKEVLGKRKRMLGKDHPSFSSLSPKRLIDEPNSNLAIAPSANSRLRFHPIADSEFRLFILQSGATEDNIVGSLRVFSLLEPPVYYALSYVWGQEPSLHRIVVDGEEEHIQPNLFHALRRIRPSRGQYPVWVDALCINQQNRFERNMQVRQMAKIYSQASGVLIWLGEEDATSRIALEFVSTILSNRYRWIDTWWEQYEFSAMAQLLERPWFRRGWVLQEAAFSKISTYLCGDRQVYMDHFFTAIKAVQDRLHTVPKTFLPIFTRFQDSPAVRLIDIVRSVYRASLKGVVPRRRLSLEALVDMTTSSETIDPRDTIYALLNMANDVALLEEPGQFDAIIPDYGKNCLDVFADFIMHCCHHSGTLDIICRPWAPLPSSLFDALDDEKRLDSCLREYPSWIVLRDKLPFGNPSWGYKLRLHGNSLVGRSRNQVYNAHYGTKPEAFVGRNDNSTCDGCLYAKGFVLAEIARRSTRMANAIITKECLGVLQPASHHTSSGFTDILDTIWRTLCANRNTEGQRAPQYYEKAMLYLLKTTLVTGSWLDLLRQFVSIDVEELLDAELPEFVEEFAIAVRNVVWNRRTFSSKTDDPTDKRLIGLIPQHSQVGDHVCILYGCSVPVVLRKTNQTDDASWKLIGDAYVHGIMDGEAISSRSSDVLKSREVDFRIF